MARKNTEETSIRKLSMIGKKTYAVSLPIELVRKLKWEKGAEISARRINDTIVLEKIES